MSAQPAPVKRHRIKRAGERRRDAPEADSSREASEEDNYGDMSDVGSIQSAHPSSGVSPVSTAAPSPRIASSAISPLHSQLLPARRSDKAKRVNELSGEASEEVDSPTYDGDVESSSTIGGTPIHSTFHQLSTGPGSSGHIRQPSSPTPLQTATSRDPASSISPLGRLPTPKASRSTLQDPESFPSPPLPSFRPTDVPVQDSHALPPPKRSQTAELSAVNSPARAGPPKMYHRPKELSEDEIRGFVQRAIDGKGEEDGIKRWWRTSEPPTDRPIRIYADGVYDLFHFGHALQLRQAKLSFPRVHLLVGVCSDQLCADHKSAPAMTHAERCESVRHCRWADEVIPDAPWVVDQAWIDLHQIDYLAHDEDVYPSKTHEDVYAFAKKSGKFLPTRRTPAISTSDLLERIVRGYREGFFDSKLEKNGHPELLAADVDWDSSASVERRERRKKKAQQPAHVV